MSVYKKFNRLLISFSGGKTSARMASRILAERKHEWREIIVAFMNTGQEHEATLRYVYEASASYGLKTIWLEAVVNPQKRKATGYKIVDYKTACRDGSIFEAMAAKYGIPNNQFPHCTRELKLRPLEAYLQAIGWETYNTAVGIRFDELDRFSPSSVEGGVIYPMIEWRETKESVLKWHSEQTFQLQIPEHYGNCTWCWKKSFRKLATVAKEHPAFFNVPRILEKDFKDHGSGAGDRRLFRGRRTVADIVAMSKDPTFEPFTDAYFGNDPEMDIGAACGDSCEIGVDGMQPTPDAK